jgi:hypothetical protein
LKYDFLRANTIADMKRDAEVSNLALPAVAAALNGTVAAALKVDARDPSLLLDLALGPFT